MKNFQDYYVLSFAGNADGKELRANFDLNLLKNKFICIKAIKTFYYNTIYTDLLREESFDSRSEIHEVRTFENTCLNRINDFNNIDSFQQYPYLWIEINGLTKKFEDIQLGFQVDNLELFFNNRLSTIKVGSFFSIPTRYNNEAMDWINPNIKVSIECFLTTTNPNSITQKALQ